MKKRYLVLMAISGFFIFGAAAASTAGAATRFVSAISGTNTGDCLLLSCKTVTYALSQAVNGDTIAVSWGTYDAALGETVPITITKNVTLQGAGSTGTTIVPIVVNNAKVNIRGFKTSGLTYHGGSGEIHHNEIINSSTDGIDSDQADTTIHDNLIRGSQYYGIRNYARNNRIFNNTVIENGLQAGWGGGVGAMSSDPIIKNNIIVANTGYGIEAYPSGNPPNDYNVVWNNSLGDYSPTIVPGTHSVSADPLFVAPSNLRPQCLAPSQVINKGDNSEVGSQLTDLGGNPRIVGDVVDIGAYEAVCSRYVSDAGNNVGECLEIAAPCRTIGYAVSRAFAGDTVSVAFGVYDQALGETFPILINKKIYLHGAGARFTKVDAEGSNQNVFQVTGSPAHISGLKITGGLHGIRYENSGSGSLSQNIITANGLHGIHSLNSNPKIINNVLSANGWSGIGIDGTAPSALFNNTIDGNLWHGVHVGTVCSVGIYSNIISYNGQYGIYHNTSGCSVSENYNLFWGNISGYLGPYTMAPINSKFSEPRFYSYNDYHLECGSPAVDSGWNSPPGGLPSTDIEGQPRVFNGTVDIGAYERQGLCSFLYLPIVVR